MKPLLLVFLGGGLGSALRYLIGRWMAGINSTFPYGTFTVNIAGCFLIGFLMYSFGRDNPASDAWRLLLITGFCGGFTTFSTFSFENFQMLQSQQLSALFLYIAASIVLGLAAAWLGILAGRGV